VTTILVTGAGGFIGRCVAARLRAAGDARIVSLERSSVALEALDPAYWKGLHADTIDVIFHLGAYTPKDAASADLIDPIVASNVNGTAALLASLPNTPRHLLFASSLDVYKRVSGRTIDETSEVGPATLYGASKLFGEELVRTYARATGCAYSILRLGHVFGPGEERYQRVIPSLIRAMLRGAEPQLSGDGTTERDYLYVDDAVSAIVAASARPDGIDPINIVRGESISILGVAKHVAALTGYEGAFRFSGGNGDSLRFDNGAMKQRLGIHSFVPFADGLAREVAHFRETEFATR
jgi:nucleoside-diphosphate-sugar epimerase